VVGTTAELCPVVTFDLSGVKTLNSPARGSSVV
jgi:hypothetical protein